MKRILAAILAAVLGANGVAMLAAGAWWYGAVPGVTMTGPYNPHFVKDIGAAYLVVAASLTWRAARPAAGQGALVASAGFLVLHGLIHIADAAMGMNMASDLLRDAAGVYAPALIAAWLALPTRKA